jgi:hypothetical protein
MFIYSSAVLLISASSHLSPFALPVHPDLAAEATRGSLDVVVADSGYSAEEATQAQRPLRGGPCRVCRRRGKRFEPG